MISEAILGHGSTKKPPRVKLHIAQKRTMLSIIQRVEALIQNYVIEESKRVFLSHMFEVPKRYSAETRIVLNVNSQLLLPHGNFHPCLTGLFQIAFMVLLGLQNFEFQRRNWS